MRLIFFVATAWAIGNRTVPYVAKSGIQSIGFGLVPFVWTMRNAQKVARCIFIPIRLSFVIRAITRCQSISKLHTPVHFHIDFVRWRTCENEIRVSRIPCQHLFRLNVSIFVSTKLGRSTISSKLFAQFASPSASIQYIIQSKLNRRHWWYSNQSEFDIWSNYKSNWKRKQTEKLNRLTANGNDIVRFRNGRRSVCLDQKWSAVALQLEHTNSNGNYKEYKMYQVVGAIFVCVVHNSRFTIYPHLRTKQYRALIRREFYANDLPHSWAMRSCWNDADGSQ